LGLTAVKREPSAGDDSLRRFEMAQWRPSREDWRAEARRFGEAEQNVNLFCAYAGLATVVRGLVDRKRLARAMGLRSDQRIALAQSVAFPLV
jgi:hypothetical protein